MANTEIILLYLISRVDPPPMGGGMGGGYGRGLWAGFFGYGRDHPQSVPGGYLRHASEPCLFLTRLGLARFAMLRVS